MYFHKFSEFIFSFFSFGLKKNTNVKVGVFLYDEIPPFVGMTKN